MARLTEALIYVPKATGAFSGLLPLDEIPDEVKAEAEEVYQALKDDEGRMRVSFTTKKELDRYLLQVRSYCAQRPAEIGGPIKFRISPTQKLPDGTKDFRISDFDEEDEANKEAIEATEAVQALGVSTPPRKAVKARR